MRLTLFNNFFIHNHWHYIFLHTLIAFNVLISERKENRSTRRKTLEAHEISTTGTLTHVKYHTRLGFSGEQHYALTTHSAQLLFYLFFSFHLASLQHHSHHSSISLLLWSRVTETALSTFPVGGTWTTRDFWQSFDLYSFITRTGFK